jgi:hypothetical protein
MATMLPPICPYPLDALLDPEWWPASRHGLTDAPPAQPRPRQRR